MNKLFVFIFSTILFFGCSTNSHKDISRVEVPEGWTKKQQISFHSLIAPEKDMKVFFLKENLKKDFDFSKKSVALWKLIKPDFAYKEVQKTTPPSKNWDRVSQIVYQVPAEEAKVVLTLVRIKNNIAYFNLIETSVSTLSKRSAQMNQMIESWRPETIQKEDFSKVSAKDFQSIQKTFEKFAVATMQDLSVPGMTIGVYQNGKVVYQKGFGQTRVKKGEPVNKNTLFMIGSTTKPLTTLLMAKLVHEGKMSWNDPINKHLTTWHLKDKEASDTMLMKHSACACTGMPRRDLDFIFDMKGFAAEDRMKQMAEMSPTTKPGETFQYSNYLVAAGGFSAARAYNKSLPLGKAYSKAMKDLVFQPLNMNQTHVHNKSPHLKNSASPHSYDLQLKPTTISNQVEEFADSIAPAGSVWSNSTDLLKYIQFELKEGQNINGYINKDNLLARRQKSITISENSYYGLGLMGSNYKGLQVFGHNGNTLGFTSDLFFLPTKNFGVTILVNLGGANTFTSLLRGKLFELMFGIDTRTPETLAYYKKELKKGVRQLSKHLKKDISNPKQLVGKYKSKELGSMTISKQGRKLTADFGEFKSDIKEKVDPGKKQVLLLTSPPWSGSLSLIKEKNGFTVQSAQKKYYFRRL